MPEQPRKDKFDLVAEIEELIGAPTTGLWRANRYTLEALLSALKRRDN